MKLIIEEVFDFCFKANIFGVLQDLAYSVLQMAWFCSMSQAFAHMISKL